MDDISKELQMIQDLMQQLQDEMQYGKKDFEERLGRKEPGVEVLKIEGEVPMQAEPDESPEMDDMEPEMDAEPMDGDEDLKQRLMKLRG